MKFGRAAAIMVAAMSAAGEPTSMTNAAAPRGPQTCEDTLRTAAPIRIL